MSPSSPPRVAISGNGVIAKTCALLLARKGLYSLLFAPVLHTAAMQRYYALNKKTITLLQELGVWQHINPAYPVSDIHLFADSARLHLSAWQVAEDNLAFIVPEYALHFALDSLLTSNKNIFIYPTALSAWQQTPEGYLVHADSKISAHQPCQAIIGCEGHLSATRQAIKSNISLRDYGQSALSFSLRIQRSHHQTAYQWFNKNPSSILAFLPIAERSVSVVWSLPRADAQQWYQQLQAANTKEDTQKLLSDTLGNITNHVLGELDCEGENFSVSMFDLRWQYAHSLYRDKIFLLGDSAHTIHPFAGQGLNVGFGDLVCLSDTLPSTDKSDWVNVWGRAYAAARQIPLATHMCLMDGLWRSFQSPGLSVLGPLGMRLSNKIPGLNTLFIKYANGQMG